MYSALEIVGAVFCVRDPVCVAALVGSWPLVDQLQIGLVNQRSCLQGVVGAFSSQEAMRLAMQFLVNEWEHLVQHGAVAFAPGAQHRGYPLGGCGGVAQNRFLKGCELPAVC